MSEEKAKAEGGRMKAEPKRTGGLGSFWQELRQRKVVRAGIAYLVVGLAIMEGGDIVLGNLGAPQWVVTALILLVIAGFPIALVLAWVYDLTPQGIRNTDTVREEQAEATGGKTARVDHPALFLFIAAAVPTLIFGAATLYFFLSAKTAKDELIFVTETQFEELDEKSIAVLPFETISSGEDDEVFSIGLHTDLVSMLMGIGGLTTIERSSTLKYQGSSQSKQSIARELSVRTLLTGTVQWSAKTVRVNVRLLDALNNNHLWADVFSKELRGFGDLLDIQAAISREIADQLEVHLSPEEEERLDKVPTESLQAWEAFVKAREIVASGVQTRRTEAIELLERAVELDPNFALAYVELGGAHRSQPAMVERGTMWEERIPLAEAAVRRALELDDQLAEAHFEWGNIQDELKRDRASAKEAYEKAVALKPNFLAAQLALAGLEEDPFPDDPSVLRQSLARYEWAVKRDPNNFEHHNKMGYSLRELGRLDEAINAYETSIRLNPAGLTAYMELGDLYAFYQGRFDKAMVYFRQAVALDPPRWRNSQRLWRCYETLGQENAKEEVLFWGKATQALNDNWGKYVEASRDSALMDKEIWANTYREIVWEYAHWPMRRILHATDLRAGRVDLALKLYETRFPFVFKEEVVIGAPVKINVPGYPDGMVFPTFVQAQVAMEMAEILIQNGDRERANYLLETAWDWYSGTRPRMKMSWGGFNGYGIYDAVRFTLKGEKENALKALREAIDVGFRLNQSFELSALDPLREEPEFIAMMEEVKTDMAQQLAEVRRMDANGELAEIPDQIRKRVEETSGTSGVAVPFSKRHGFLFFVAAAVPTLIFGSVALYFFLRTQRVKRQLAKDLG